MKSYKGYCKGSIYEHLGIWEARFDNDNIYSDDTTEDMTLVLVLGTLEFLSHDDVSNVLSSFENPNSIHKTKKGIIIWKKSCS